MSGAVEGVARDALNHHEQMLDAQAGCVPCKLCAGSAIITDAGIGAGYYIQCGNSLSFRDSKGCMLDGRRLGGWAYNVMDWWNRLHAVTTPPARTYAQGVEDATKVAENLCADMTVEANAETASLTSTLHRASAQTASKIAAAIRLLSQGEKA